MPGVAVRSAGRFSDDLRTEVVLDALGMAVTKRSTTTGLVAHSDSETVRAGVLGVPDPHGDGHARMLVPGAPRFLTRTPIDEVLSSLGYVGPWEHPLRRLASPSG